MHAKDFFINDCRTGKAVEAIRKGLPEFNTKSSLAFIVESVDTVDGSAFVISTKKKKVFGILDFVGKQETDSLKRLFASIDIITKENVIGFRRKATVFK
jgi:hypothetical protein